jgi:hypothetical protein
LKLSEYNLRGWKYFDVAKSTRINSNLSVLLLNVDLTILGGKGNLKNLVAIDNNENIIWIAQIPNGFTLKHVFTDLEYEGDVLKAWRGNLYCEIDIETGNVLNEQETH